MKKIKFLLTAMLLTSFTTVEPSVNASPGNTSNFIKGKLSGKLTKDMNGVYKFFNDNKDKFKIDQSEKEFQEISEKEDSLNFKHIRVQQIVQGIPVYGNEYIVHFNKEGEVYAVNGKFDPGAKKVKVDKTKFIGEDKSVEIAKSQVKFDRLEIAPKAKLYLYELKNEYIPVYEVGVNFISPIPGDWHFFINAYDGQVVDKFNAIG